MNPIITGMLAIGGIIISVAIGIIIGLFMAKYKYKKEEKSLMENLIEVMDGKRENSIEIDGKKYDASKFRTKDKNGKESLIDLKGGEIKQNAKAKEEENKSEDSPDIGENSNISGESSPVRKGKKRTFGNRRRGRFC